MNSMKKMSITLFVVAVALIMVGNSLIVYQVVAKESTNVKEIEKTLVADLENFKNQIDSFTNARDEYSNNVEINMFPETFEEEYENWIIEIDKYTAVLDKIDSSSKNLKKNCIDHHYSDTNVKNKCDAFNTAYETIVNYYVTDITSFNNNLDELNKDLIRKKGKYDLKYKLIDANKDGNYLGTE